MSLETSLALQCQFDVNFALCMTSQAEFEAVLPLLKASKTILSVFRPHLTFRAPSTNFGRYFVIFLAFRSDFKHLIILPRQF